MVSSMRTRLLGPFTRVRLAVLGALLAALSATALATTRVSDQGGYKATDVTVFSFIDVSAGGATILTGADDDKVALTLPFAFTFFGHAYPMVCVSSNGAAYFIDVEAECGSIPNDFANVDLTQAPSPSDRAGLFPLWSDLALPGAGTGVAYQTQGDAPHRKFVLQWNNAYPLSKGGGPLSAPVTFEAILLEENNQILFQYDAVDLGADPASNGGHATVGIRNHGALVDPGPTFGQQIAWSYNSAVLANGKAILFTGSKGTPVVTATGGTFPNNGSPHAGSGAAYGTGGLSEVLSPAVTLSYAGIAPTSYGPLATPPALGGTYEVTANFAGNADYTSGSGTAPLTITQGVQTITFTSTAPVGAKVGPATYAVSAMGGLSGNPVTFSSLTDACTATGTNGSTISFIAAGSCTVAADQAGNASYAPAAQATQTFSVGKGAQTISITSAPPSAATVGGATYALSATGGLSVNPVTFSSLTAGVCTVGGNGFSVSFLIVGSCQVAADQAGDLNYDAATQKTQTFNVGKGAQAINFTSSVPLSAVVGGPTYAVAATGGGSGSTVTFSSLTTLVCTAGAPNGSTISFIAVGNCQVAANQPGNTNYNAAGQQTQTFAVGQGGTQTISFTSTTPTAATVGGATYGVAATGGASGNPVTFSSLTTGVCTASGTYGSTISFIAVGTCQVAADQTGNGSYTAAPQQTQNFAVGKGAQGITFTSAAVSPTVGGAAYVVSANGGASNNTVTFSSLTTLVCTAGAPNGSTINFLTAGNCRVAANQLGNGTYNAAPQETQSFTVGKGAQVISFTSTAPAAATVGGATYTAAATGGGSGNAVTFSSLTTGVCTASGTNGATISFVGAGSCTVAADQAGNENYDAAPQVTQIFALNTYTLTYTAGANGTLAGTTPQTVNSGANGSQVTAVANTGYHFVSWSDGGTTAARTDTNVTTNLSVTASFALDPLTFNGFDSPYGPPDPATVNGVVYTSGRMFKVGSTLPIKFGWKSNGVRVASADANPTIGIYGPYVCGIDTPADAIVAFTDPGSSTLTYDSTTKTWNRNLQLKPGFQADRCYSILVTSPTAGYGSSEYSLFKLQK